MTEGPRRKVRSEAGSIEMTDQKKFNNYPNVQKSHVLTHACPMQGGTGGETFQVSSLRNYNNDRTHIWKIQVLYTEMALGLCVRLL